MQQPLDAAGKLVRRNDPERFLTVQFAPADCRDALLAIYAFNYEVARVREIVSEPVLGQIRLQWWHDAIAEIAAGRQPRAHEVVTPLAAAIRRHSLPATLLWRLIDAREQDLAGDPPADLPALAGYADGTAGSLVELALAVLGETGDTAARVAHLAGVGIGLAGLMRAVPFHAGARRCYLPGDLVAAAGLDLEAVFAGHCPPALAPIVRRVAGHAAAHLAEAAQASAALPATARPALLPVVLARRWLADLARAGHDPFVPVREAPIRRLLALASAAWRGL